MIVIFTSRSEKKATQTVRKILDNFANRVGNDTWMSVMSLEGLAAVKTALRRHVSKGMAVACHRIATRSTTKLLWIVGNRHCFNEAGVVPTGTTEKDLSHNDWENNWTYMPVLKAVVAMALLLHDIGKNSDFFQKKLRANSRKGDPYRHEWVSCKIIEALIYTSDSPDFDKSWLSAISEGKWDTSSIISYLNGQSLDELTVLKKLPPVAEFLCWLIMSHHRLPLPDKRTINLYTGGNTERLSFADMMKSIDGSWGYLHIEDATDEDRRNCFTFSQGILWEECHSWLKLIKKWAGRLLEQQETLSTMILEGMPKFRSVATYTRLCMMLSDHYCSSSFYKPDTKSKSRWIHNNLWANTNKKGGRNQYLEEHLVLTAEQGLRIAHSLPRLSNQMESAYDVKSLEKKSPGKFAWQDKAVNAIKKYRNTSENKTSWFAINMASTGCGKTIANAKIVRALSENGDSLRYILALGLRSLTLQTGDSYKKDLHLDKDELAVLIGSAVIQELHDQNGTESSEELLPEQLDYSNTISDSKDEFLDIFFDSQNPSANKAKAFLYKPVLCNTIDHIMGSVQSLRGGRYILPMLRLMSSDLIIDEIDDFAPKDLLAICRLVHLAGLFGRNVGISSATIPPDLAEALYRSYIAGLASYNDFFSEKKRCAVLWCDEYNSVVSQMNTLDNAAFAVNHQNFIAKRVKKLAAEPVKRKAFIAECDVCDDMEEYAAHIQESILTLHQNHHIIDKKTAKNVSFGLVRTANINPCVYVSKYLMNADWPDDTEVRVLPYHSRQVLLMRYMEERYLDSVLRRKYDDSIPVNITDSVIRSHLDHSDVKNFIFILVSTPVEEVGRDHDFDWGIVEPSSYRSIIQLSGRIRRHRKTTQDINQSNLAIMQFNIKSLEGAKQAYCKPGFEEEYILRSHDMEDIGDVDILNTRIDSIPRIQKRTHLDVRGFRAGNLVDLEQKVMEDINSKSGEKSKGLKSIEGWFYEYWWLTAIPMYINRFRAQSNDNLLLYAVYNNESVHLKLLTDAYQYVTYEEAGNITIDNELSDLEKERLWISRDYIEALRFMANNNPDITLESISKRYGELTIPVYKNKATPDWIYSSTFGLYKDKEDL